MELPLPNLGLVDRLAVVQITGSDPTFPLLFINKVRCNQVTAIYSVLLER